MTYLAGLVAAAMALAVVVEIYVSVVMPAFETVSHALRIVQ